MFLLVFLTICLQIHVDLIKRICLIESVFVDAGGDQIHCDRKQMAANRSHLHAAAESVFLKSSFDPDHLLWWFVLFLLLPKYIIITKKSTKMQELEYSVSTESSSSI